LLAAIAGWSVEGRATQAGFRWGQYKWRKAEIEQSVHLNFLVSG